MKTYRTKEVAQCMGIHPNTVRMYEAIQFIAPPKRRQNGHREFTSLHIQQIQLIQIALRGELLQNGLRKQAIHIIKLSGACAFEEAIRETYHYKSMLDHESNHAKQAIQIVAEIIQNQTCMDLRTYKRQEAADLLEVTIDTLRNWERNGLTTIPRKSNGYRSYSGDDLMRLKIIRTLRCANYSLTSILRLMNKWPLMQKIEMERIMDTPEKDEDIISVCDHLLTSLHRTNQDADEILLLLAELLNKPPL